MKKCRTKHILVLLLINTVLFVSCAHEETDPVARIHYSVENQTGESVWFGLNIGLNEKSEILEAGGVSNGVATLDGEYSETYGLVENILYFAIYDAVSEEELYRYEPYISDEEYIDPETGKYYIEDPAHKYFWYDNDTNTLYITAVPEPG